MGNEAIIEKFVVNDLLLGAHQGEINSETSLISSGIIDSLSLIRLINFVEERFNIIINDDEVVPDNFETIKALITLISRKQSA